MIPQNKYSASPQMLNLQLPAVEIKRKVRYANQTKIKISLAVEQKKPPELLLSSPIRMV
jgi:hypothetical protein